MPGQRANSSGTVGLPRSPVSQRGKRSTGLRLVRASALLVAMGLTALLGSVPTAAAAGGDYYVAPGGSDSAAGKQTAPWRTIRYGIGRLAAGDTLFVRGGSYRESVTGVALRKGTRTERVTVQAFPGERPVLQGLIWLNQADYWTIDGLNVTWDGANGPSQHMFRMIDGVGWSVENAEIWGARSYAGLLVAGTLPGQPADWVVRGNCIHDTVPSNRTNQDHNIYVNTATGGGGIVARNIVFAAPNGMNIKLGPSSEGGPGPSGVTVRYNTFVSAAYNVGVHWSASGNLFRHNLMGNTHWNYGNFYSYELTSSDNVARDNAGFQAGTERLISGDAGYEKVSDGGGNEYPVEPKFDATGTCDGYRPGSAAARGFGAYAGT